jgi:hypothetical protein
MKLIHHSVIIRGFEFFGLVITTRKNLDRADPLIIVEGSKGKYSVFMREAKK